MRGRKPKEESQAAELCQRLLIWKQVPESSRTSLRALARNLGVSHQLLRHYVKRLDKWQAEEYWRRARLIRAHAMARYHCLP